MDALRRRGLKRRTTEMIRLPTDVTFALRRRAVAGDVTMGEAARQLMLASQLGGNHGAIEHLEWLHDRLVREKAEFEDVLAFAGRDPAAVDKAIEGLAALRDEWQSAALDDENEMFYHGHGL
jgi:hypothetical protein